MTSPSGRQFEIAHGRQRAIVVEVGGGLRVFSDDGRPVVEPYALGSMCDGAHGAPLIPWPNRIGQGRYRFDGVDHQLDLSEPDLGNAIHGLVRWRSWQALVHEPSRVVMGLRLYPTPGYPFALDLRLDYALGADGLTVAIEAANVGSGPLPYACGQHVYLSPGADRIDGASLSFAAATRIVTDPAHHLPAGREPVGGTPYDFSRSRAVGDGQIDAPFTDLARDGAGKAWVRLNGVDGRRVELWQDAAFPYVQIYTGDTLAPARRRTGLAAEPMTAPPDAFRTGEGVLVLEPQETATARWGVRLA